jgi:hypothetical protein
MLFLFMQNYFELFLYIFKINNNYNNKKNSIWIREVKDYWNISISEEHKSHNIKIFEYIIYKCRCGINKNRFENFQVNRLTIVFLVYL